MRKLLIQFLELFLKIHILAMTIIMWKVFQRVWISSTTSGDFRGVFKVEIFTSLTNLDQGLSHKDEIYANTSY